MTNFLEIFKTRFQIHHRENVLRHDSIHCLFLTAAELVATNTSRLPVLTINIYLHICIIQGQ